MADESAFNIDAHVGARLRLRRRIIRMSQGELSQALGVSYQQLQKYERGANRISAGTLWRTAQELKVPIGYFFEGLSGEDFAETSDSQITAFLHSKRGSQFAELLLRIEDARVQSGLLTLLRALANSGAPLGVPHSDEHFESGDKQVLERLNS